jgi:hypothetical protein
VVSGEWRERGGRCRVSGARRRGFKIPDSIFKTAGSPYPRVARTGLGFLARRGARSLGGAVLAG